MMESNHDSSQASFDPYSWSSFFYGKITRDSANNILADAEEGVFILRESSTIHSNYGADYVLCVKEYVASRNTYYSHYIITREMDTAAEPAAGTSDQNNGGGESSRACIFRIGEIEFHDIPQLLNHYCNFLLEATKLVRPVLKKSCKYIAMYDFSAGSCEDMSFRKGEVLWVTRKPEDSEWWYARNDHGLTGQVPSNYLHAYDAETVERLISPRSSQIESNASRPAENADSRSRIAFSNRTLPAWARVKQLRVPNAYDKKALRLEVGDRILVTKISASGTWEGELNGRKGEFPFTYIVWEDDENDPNTDRRALNSDSDRSSTELNGGARSGSASQRSSAEIANLSQNAGNLRL